MQAAISFRVASTFQGADPAAELLEQAEDLCRQKGWTVLDRYIDAYTKGRPALDRLRQDLEAPRFDVLICRKLEDLGADVLQVMLERDIRLIALIGTYDSERPEDRARLDAMLSGGRLELSKTRSNED